jgi:phosphoglycerol transferase MdoB-like AlkP superfamily enzyme
MVIVTARFLYYRKNKGKAEFLFAYISFSTIIFIVCLLLSNVPVEMGFALGLFAVFSIIRFRSIQITPRELSYLLISLGFAILNALYSPDRHIMKLIVTNLLIFLIIGTAEFLLFRSVKMIKYITYDRLDLIDDTRRDELKEDLQLRFGIKDVKLIQIGNINVTKNRVELKVTFIDKAEENFHNN